MKRTTGLLCALAGLLAGSAEAGPDWSFGPSIPLVRLDTGGRTSLAPGAGVQGGLGWKVKGCPFVAPGDDCLHIDGTVFGAIFGQTTFQAAGSVALLGCYGHNLACLGFGVDLASTAGGLFSGFTWRRSTFALFSVGLEALAAIAARHPVAGGDAGQSWAP